MSPTPATVAVVNNPVFEVKMHFHLSDVFPAEEAQNVCD